jgi:hypothetical protein
LNAATSCKSKVENVVTGRWGGGKEEYNKAPSGGCKSLGGSTERVILFIPGFFQPPTRH